MIALQFPDVKDFMQQLLCSSLFDHFLLTEASITTFVTHSIDGRLFPDFFPEDSMEDSEGSDKDSDSKNWKKGAIAPFSALRPYCFSLIKGKQSPLSFQFTFQLTPENQEKTLEKSGTGFTEENVSAMFLHLKYQEKKLQCTTGISYKSFTMDKSLEQEWDRLVQLFFKSHKIPFEML